MASSQSGVAGRRFAARVPPASNNGVSEASQLQNVGVSVAAGVNTWGAWVDLLVSNPPPEGFLLGLTLKFTTANGFALALAEGAIGSEVYLGEWQGAMVANTQTNITLPVPMGIRGGQRIAIRAACAIAGTASNIGVTHSNKSWLEG